MNNVLIAILGVALFGANWVSVGQTAPLVILATHDLPTEFEQTLLSTPATEWRESAKIEGYLVEEADGFVFVRHKDLFNLATMEKLIHAIGAVSSHASPRTKVLRLDKLDRAEADGFLGLLANSTVIRDGNTSLAEVRAFVLEPLIRVTVGDGSRTLTLQLPQVAGDDLRDEDFTPVPSVRSTEPQQQRPGSTMALRSYRDSLMFSFGKSGVVSAKRAQGAEMFAKRIYEELEAQREKYEAGQDILRASLIGKEGVPRVGESLSLLAGPVQSFLQDSVLKNPKIYGFDTGADLQAFLGSARVQQVRVDGLLGIGVIVNGERRIHSMLINIDRNPKQ